MPSLPQSLLSYLRVVAGAWRDDPREDAELLARFAESSDEAAFKVLICRHGPVVWQSCMRVLGDGPDAEDAFQTAFMALAHQASRLRREPLAGWLHRVARRAALKVNVEARRRRNVEHHLRAVTPSEAADIDRAELYAALDEELAGLPERLRVPLVLRYLEGKTQDEVARILGCSRSVALKRLARGEAILRERLEWRGLVVCGVATLLTSSRAISAVPACLIGSTARAAVAFRSGALTDGIAEAARAVLESHCHAPLARTILRKSLWVVLACCLGLGSAILVTCRSMSARPDEASEVSPAITQTPGELGTADRAAIRVDCYGDPLPAGGLARMGTVRQWYGRLEFPPFKGVLAFSRDDKMLASQSDDGSVCLWDMTTGKEIRRIAKKPGVDTARWSRGNTLLAFSPDGRTLAIVYSGAQGNEGTVNFWDMATGKLLHQLKRTQQPKRETVFLDMSFLPNGKILTLEEAKDSDNKIYLWEVATGGREISRLKDWKNLKFHPRTRALAFSRDGKMVAAAENPFGKKIQLWDVATGKKIRQLQLTAENESLCSVTFSPDGKTLAMEGSDVTCVWEVATGKPIHQFKAGGSPLAYSPDGKTLVGGSDGHLWDVTTGKEIRLFGWENARVAVFSHNGKFVAVGDEAGVIRSWEVATGKEILPHKGHHDRVTSIAYSPDGKTLASVSADKTVRLWEAATGKEIRQLAKHPTWTWGSGSLAYSPDGKILVSMEDDMLHLWDTATGKEIRQFQLEFQVGRGWLQSVTFSPDGKLLAATLSNPEQVLLVQVATGKQICTLSPVGSGVKEFGRPVAFSPDGRMLAAPGKEEGTVGLWEVLTGKFIGQLPLKQDGRRVLSLAFSPDGRILATSSEGCRSGEDRAYLWEVATGKEICHLNGRKGGWAGGWPLTFSPDGRILVTVERAGWNDPKKIRLWEVASGKEIGQLSGHRSAIRCVAFSPDGKTLASSSDDLTCLVWDLTTVGRLKTAPALPLVPQALPKERLEAAWADLAKDPTQAYAAVRVLQTVPAQAIPLLRERVRPVAPVADPKQLKRWITDLDDGSFTVRDKAQQEIETLGEVAVPALRQALKDRPGLEARRRLQALLAELEPKVVGVSPHRMRELRAVQVLESVGTAEARQLLLALAKGVSGARLTVEAEAALARLVKRPVAKP